MRQKRKSNNDRTSKRADTVKARADALMVLAAAASTWYRKTFDLPLVNAFTDYAQSQDCYDELYHLADKGVTPQSFVMTLRNPGASVGFVDHLDKDHFHKWVLFACDQDPEALKLKPVSNAPTNSHHVQQSTQVCLTGALSHHEKHRNVGVTSLSCSVLYDYVRKYGTRMLSADQYLNKIDDQGDRKISRIGTLAGVKTLGVKFLQGGFALTLMNELSVLKEITQKFQDLQGDFKSHGKKVKDGLNAKAREKFQYCDDGVEKTFILAYLKSSISKPKPSRGSQVQIELI